MEYYACIDIGGTAIKYGVVSENFDILFKSSMPTEAQKGPSVWMLNVVDEIEQMKSEYKLSGICVSSSAMINTESGRVFFSLPQIPNYTGFDVKGFLENHCSLPCEVENDVNCVVLAESILGSGKGYDTVLGIAIGTGVGGGFANYGRILHGATYSACEVGYIKVEDSDLEHKGSTTALCRKVEFLKNDAPSSWDGRRIFASASEGDKDCIMAIDEMASSIAKGMVSLSYILNPHAIVLGGGIMNEESLFRKIKDYYKQLINPLIAENTAIHKAKFGNDAGMLGALINFKQKREL